MIDFEEYKSLISQVNFYRNEINLFNNEILSEDALDDLKHKITVFEAANPSKILPNSPNYTIAGGIRSGFAKYTHQRRMLSLNDIFDFEELKAWEIRWQKHLEQIK